MEQAMLGPYFIIAAAAVRHTLRPWEQSDNFFYEGGTLPVGFLKNSSFRITAIHTLRLCLSF